MLTVQQAAQRVSAPVLGSYAGWFLNVGFASIALESTFDFIPTISRHILRTVASTPSAPLLPTREDRHPCLTSDGSAAFVSCRQVGIRLAILGRMGRITPPRLLSAGNGMPNNSLASLRLTSRKGVGSRQQLGVPALQTGQSSGSQQPAVPSNQRLATLTALYWTVWSCPTSVRSLLSTLSRWRSASGSVSSPTPKARHRSGRHIVSYHRS